MAKNITLALDEAVLDKVRRIAVDRKTTVNGLADQEDRSAKARQEIVRRPGRLVPTGSGTVRKFLTATHFVDTNIWLYAVMQDPARLEKRRKALDLISTIGFGISAQVLAEFYSVVTRKGAPPMAPLKALEWVQQFAAHPCALIDAALVIRGTEKSARFQISYWDGAIPAATEALGATTVYSENLNHR